MADWLSANEWLGGSRVTRRVRKRRAGRATVQILGIGERNVDRIPSVVHAVLRAVLAGLAAFMDTPRRRRAQTHPFGLLAGLPLNAAGFEMCHRPHSFHIGSDLTVYEPQTSRAPL
jgi:hypothetical protein